MRLGLCVLALGLWAGLARAADQPAFGPPGGWVRPLAIPKPGPAEDGAATQILLEDVQDNFGADGKDRYWEKVERILTPQGLESVGNIAIDWRPDTENLIIHRVHIIRGDRVIDVLANGQKFIVLRRENRLELAMLDGTLTAAIEPEGLEVGDSLDLAITLQERDPILEGRSEGAAMLPATPAARFVIREIWSGATAPKWRQTGGLDAPKITQTATGGELLIDMANASRPKAPKGAPGRYSEPGRFESTSSASWAEVSALMAPLYAKATELRPDSPLKQEAAAIAAATDDPKLRAAAALKLVQDKVRYLFLGMNNGGYVPADADVTWSRRFGDCKGKTTLLLALLHALDVEAEPALANIEDGDGMESRVPMVGAFDHVLVRATIAGKVYWMDGTRTGDRTLNALAIPGFHWVLPVRAEGAALEKLVVPPLDTPQELTELHLDASAGLDIPAPAHAQLTLRGDSAIGYKERLATMSRADIDHYLRDYWSREYDWIDIAKVEASYDDTTGEEHVSMDGTAKMDWKQGSGSLGRRYETDGGGLGWKADYDREPGPDQDAPFAVNYPHFSASAETIILPNHGTGFTIEGDRVKTVIAGREFVRTAMIQDGVFTMSAGTRAIAPEFPAAEAPAAKKALRDLWNVTVHLRAPSRYRLTDQELAALPPPATADDFFNLGFQYGLRSDYAHGIPNYDRAIALRPDWSLAYANRGSDRFFNGDIDGASADFDKALALDPRQVVAIRGRGLLFARKGQYQDAIDAYTRAIDIEPDNAFAFDKRGRAYWAIHDGDKALSDLAAALTLDPDIASLHYLRADIFRTRGDGAHMLAEADALMDRRPDANAHILRAKALVLLDKKDEARTELDNSVALEPKDGYVLEQRGRTYSALGAGDQALADYAALLQQEPGRTDIRVLRLQILIGRRDSAQVMGEADQLFAAKADALGHFARGYGFLLAAKPADARTEFDASIAIQPDAGSYIGRAMTRGKDEIGRSAEDIDLALRIAPNADIAGAAYLTRAGLYLAARQFDNAIRDYDSALEKMPGNASAISMRSYALAENHQYDQAVAGIDQLLSKTPGNPVLLNNRCWYRAISGQHLEEALADCTTGLGIQPDSAMTLDSRGLVYLRLGRIDDAIADYDAALKQRPDQVTSLFGRGLAKLRKGETGDAQADLTAARTADPKIEAQFADYGVKP